VSLERPPEVLLEYFHRFIEEMESLSKGRLYRYTTPAEAATWVARGEFDILNNSMGKMCTTLFPILNTVGISKPRPVLMVFSEELYEYAVAVPYTYENDPSTGDILYPFEFELSIYSSPKRPQGPSRDYVSVEKASYVRLLRNVGVSVYEYRRARTLPHYLYNRVYARYNYTMVPRGPLVRYIAVQVAVWHDDKMIPAFAIAWDRYWEARYKLAYPPRYTNAESRYRVKEFREYYSTQAVHFICQQCQVPARTCDEVVDDVVRELKEIYGLAGVDLVVRYAGEAVVEPPVDRERDLKWWHGTEYEYERYMEQLREQELRGVPKYPPTYFDPSIEVEDWWEP
jgi:hypothetical protein